MYVEQDRTPDPGGNPNVTWVNRIGPEGFEFVKEVKSSTTETIVDDNELHTVETTTINRYISKVSQYPG